MIGLVVLMRDIFWRWGFFLGGGRRRSSGKGGGYLALIWLGVGLVLAILAPLAVMLIRAAISRQREYLADAGGAMMTRNPAGLASALAKIGGTYDKLRRQSTATAHLFISSPKCKDRINPKKPNKPVKVNLFASHPPIKKRVDRLRSLNLSGEVAEQLDWARSPGAGNTGLSSSYGSMGLAEGQTSQSAPPETDESKQGSEESGQGRNLDDYFKIES
jgi:Zn-dependent protease with chaperone function